MVIFGSSSQEENEMAKIMAQKGGNLVIISPENTPLIAQASLVIGGKVSYALELLLKELDLQIPRFTPYTWA